MVIYYGNGNRILSGKIREIQKTMIKVEFKTGNKEKAVNIPKNIINSEYELKTGIWQLFEIPTWFLKRNRIIPLNEQLRKDSSI